MSDDNKLWPVNQLLEDIYKSKVPSKFLKIKSNDLSVIIAILSFVDNKTLEGWPSVEAISAKCLKTPKRTRQVIERLKKNEIFTITERYSNFGDRDSNLYKYHPENIWKVGAICTLPIQKKSKKVGVICTQRLGTNDPYGRVQTYPLTTNTTNHVTKKSNGFEKNDYRPQPKEWSGPAETAKRAAGLLEDFMKNKKH